MRCYCSKCYENENGYCSCSDYVNIDENGECTIMNISIILGSEETDDD